MPQSTEVDYVDSELQVQEEEPSTIAELVALIGEEAVVENVNSNLRYRNKYPRVYKLVSKALAEAGFPRAQKVKDGVPVVKVNKTDKSETPVLVDPIEHIRQVIGLGDEGKAKAAAILTPIAQSEPMFVKGERTGGGGKVSQDALNASNSKFAAGDEAVSKAVEIIEAQVPGYKVGLDADGSATPESLARGIQALQKHLAAKALAESKAMLG